MAQTSPRPMIPQWIDVGGGGSLVSFEVVFALLLSSLLTCDDDAAILNVALE